MVLDPDMVTQAVRQAILTRPTDTSKEDPRTRQAQLSFSAMLAAVQSNCNCEACQLLREAVDTMRVRPRQEAPSHGSGIDPQP